MNVDVNTSAFVAPGGLRDVLTGWIPAVFLAVFGMGEDVVGRAATMLYDDRAMLMARQQMPLAADEQPLLSPANLVIPIGDDEGRYRLYFKVELVVDPATRSAADVIASMVHP